MARIISATVAGAVVYFIWGMLAWMVIPIHDSSIRELPNEQALIDNLRSLDLETGYYVAPYASDPADMSDAESAFMKNHRAGPIFSLILRKEGGEPMSVGVLLAGFIIDLLAAGLAVGLLVSLGPCGNNYRCRVGFVAGLGVFVAIVGHFSYWNWMYFPLDYTIAFAIDVVVGWTLAGLAIAALVRPHQESGTEKEKSVEQRISETASQVEPVEDARLKPAPEKPSQPSPRNARNDAISLLATLQREARFVDIVKEPLAEYSDAQVGAAARDVLRDCGSVLDRLFKIQPILEQAEGTEVQVPSGSAAGKIRLTGKTSESEQVGSLVHHGWEAQQCELPSWSGSTDAAMVIAAAEVEAKQQ